LNLKLAIQVIIEVVHLGYHLADINFHGHSFFLLQILMDHFLKHILLDLYLFQLFLTLSRLLHF
jgi:hypothetical protein